MLKSGEMIDLYHRTSRDAAAKIFASRAMLSKENTLEVYFSTHRDGEKVGYGDAIVHIRVPHELVELEDEFPSGEQHFRVHTDHLRPEHFVQD